MANFWRLVAQEDTDGDLRITVHDHITPFKIRSQNRTTVCVVSNEYPLSVLLQELKRAEDDHRAEISMSQLHLNESVVDRTHRLIKDYYWNALTRRIDAARYHDPRQWDYPYGWPPHQILTWQGLKNYGLNNEAGELAHRWLYTIAKNAHDHNGVIPEKYNVVTGSHEVFVECGNVGTKFNYITPEGFGWMNASFEVGLTYLSPEQLVDLRALKPPPPVKR